MVVWRWSRVSRNRLDWAMAVERVESAGGTLESATEGFDVSTAVGRFARGMMAEFAAFESDRMGDVWREVRERRARLGLPVMGHEQFGYVKTSRGYVPDPRTGKVLASMYRLFNDGGSLRSVTAWLNKRRIPTARQRGPWVWQVVGDILDRGFGAGYIIADGQHLPGAHQPVITEAEWQVYQARRATRTWNRVPPDQFLLAGILWCECGTAMGTVAARSHSDNMAAKYCCHQHHGTTRHATVVQRRVDPLMHEWLQSLVQPTLGAYNRAAAQRAATRQWVQLRHQQITLLTEPAAPAALPAARVRQRAAPWTQHADGEAASIPREPDLIAQALLEDWDHLTTDRRRGRLAPLVRRIVLSRPYLFVRLSIDTTWDTTVVFDGLRVPSAGANQPALLSELAPPVTDTAAPVHTEALLRPVEAARKFGITTTTLRAWYRQGLLPRSVDTMDGCRYSPSDLRVVRQARGPKKFTRRTASALRTRLKQAEAVCEADTNAR